MRGRIGGWIDRRVAHRTLDTAAHARTHTLRQADFAIFAAPTAVIGSAQCQLRTANYTVGIITHARVRRRLMDDTGVAVFPAPAITIRIGIGGAAVGIPVTRGVGNHSTGT